MNFGLCWGMGLFGVTVAEEYGGANMGYPCPRRGEWKKSPFASASIGLSYGAPQTCVSIKSTVTVMPAQKAKYLPKLVSGEHIGALAIKWNANAGSDVVSMSYTPVKRRPFHLKRQQDVDHQRSRCTHLCDLR